MNRFINKVFHGDALALLRVMPTASIDAVLADAMYGTAKKCRYDWGLDPAQGNPVLHWRYHGPIYDECRRVLKPGGVFAWAQSPKFYQHFPSWFGQYGLWTPICISRRHRQVSGHLWIVQTREQQPFPDRGGLIPYDTLPRGHPCPKPVEEMVWMVEALTKPGQIILDCFCALGSTLVAAHQLDCLWIGCDKSRTYCQVAVMRLDDLKKWKVA